MKKHRLILLFLLSAALLALGVCASAESGVLALPDSVAVIGEEAFAGTTSFWKVIVPAGATAIESRAFADSALAEIVLPASVTSIAEDAFEGCDDLIVAAPRGSYAHGWALARGMVRPRYRALLIGQNTYETNPLRGCVNDMTAMAGTLGTLLNRFEAHTAPNLKGAQILPKVAEVFADMTEEDVSLFYYAGHGVNAGGEADMQGALLGVDNQAVSFAELAAALARVPGRVIVILDSCYSGASIDRSTRAVMTADAFNSSAISAFARYDSALNEATRSGELAQSKFVVITAASQLETSGDFYYDGSGYRQGCFSAAFIQGMGSIYPDGHYSGSTPADADGNLQITLGEIYDYTRITATGWRASQTAQCYGDEDEVLFRRG